MMGENKEPRLEKIPVSRLRPRKGDLRGDPAPEELKRLAASIRKHGLIHPLLVRPLGRDYEIVCGERRFRACQQLGMGEVPALVRDLDDRQAFELSLAENARRESFSPEARRELKRRLAELFPGRRPEELEAWMGPEEAPSQSAGGDSLAGWLERIPDTQPRREMSVVLPSEEAPPAPGGGTGPTSDTKVFVAPPDMVIRKQGLLRRVKALLNKLGKSGRLDAELLRIVVAEIFRKFETQPLHDFLDLSYRARARKYVSRHCLNVSKLALFLAHSLGLPREELEQVVICGLLHDVGMMKVKEEVFTKHAALDQEEWDQVKGHPIEGALLLTKEVLLRDVVARVALEHHEKPDGTGYPTGKKKEETHLYARLINIVDTYGAMVSPRAHRLPLLPYQAMRIVMDDGAKGMLDWDLVHAFVKAMSVYPVGSYLRLEGGEIARVVRASPDIPEKPVIAVVADAQRNVLRVPVEIDLAMTEPLPRFDPIPSPI